MKILIKNGYVVDMNLNNKLKYEVKDILIENDRIIKVEKNIDDKVDKVIDASYKTVMPGLVNCHNHSPMSLFRGYADDSNLMEWLEKHIWPAEDKMTGEDAFYGTYLSCLEMIRTGTTTFNDMYFFMEDVVKAVKKTGIRAMLGRTIMSADDENEIRIKEAKELYNKYNNNGRIKVNITCHAPYTCNDTSLKIASKLAKDFKTPLHIHLGETKTEYEDMLKNKGITPTKYLDNLGIFKNNHVILAHGIWLDDNDVKLIKNIKGGIVHNPVSNCKLGSGICNVTKYLKEGINVGLGTDGSGSTNTLDMFTEMRLCSYLQKVNNLESTAIDAYEVLKMATINGAKVLGIENEIGSIEVNKKADIIIIDNNKLHLNPINDVIANLVYSTNGEDVETTIIDGDIIMENYKFLNENVNEIIDKCNKIANKLFD